MGEGHFRRGGLQQRALAYQAGGQRLRQFQACVLSLGGRVVLLAKGGGRGNIEGHVSLRQGLGSGSRLLQQGGGPVDGTRGARLAAKGRDHARGALRHWLAAGEVVTMRPESVAQAQFSGVLIASVP